MKRILVLALVAALVISVPVMASPFPDFDEDHWAYDAVTVLYAAGLLRGYPDGTLQIRQEMTRAEAIRLVADTFQYLNDRIDALKGGDTTFGDTEETAVYLRTVVQEALTEKLGYQVDKRTIDEIIASIEEMKANFEQEQNRVDSKFAEIDVKFSALDSQLANYSKEMESLKQLHKADLEKITAEYTSELNKIKSDMAGLQASIAELQGAKDYGDAVASIQKDVKSAMQDIASINKRLDKFQFSGSSEVLLRKVNASESLPTDGVFKGFSAAQAFRHELDLNFDIRPSDEIFIGFGMTAVNDFAGPGIARPFNLEALKMTIDTPDFLGVYGDQSPVSISDLVLKDYKADGMKLVGKTGVFEGAQVLVLEDRNYTGKYVGIATADLDVSDDMTVGVGFAEIFNGLTKTVEDRVLMAFGEAKLLDDTWTVKGEVVSSGTAGTTDDMASKIVAQGPLGPVDAKLTHTSAGATYSPLALQGNKAAVAAGKSIFTGDLSMPVDKLPGLTARAGIELSKGEPGETTTRIGANYLTSLVDLDGTFEVDLERESKGAEGRNLGFVKAVWNEPVKNGVLEAGYAVKPVKNSMATETETSLKFDWELIEDLKLGASYVATPSKKTTGFGLDYGFMLGSFKAGVDVDVISTHLASEAKPSKDSVVDFTLGRKLSQNTGLSLGWKTLNRLAADGVKSSASVTSASVKVDF